MLVLEHFGQENVEIVRAGEDGSTGGPNPKTAGGWQSPAEAYKAPTGQMQMAAALRLATLLSAYD